MSDIRIVLAEPDEGTQRALLASIEKQNYLVVASTRLREETITVARQLRPDIVLLSTTLTDGASLDVATVLCAEELAPVILLAHDCTRELVQQARAAGVISLLVKPIKDGELMPVLEVTRVRWQERNARKKELAQLHDKIETRKVIERAKGYLMDSQGLQEAEAFRKIQRLAMNSRRTMREVAQAILLAQQIQP